MKPRPDLWIKKYGLSWRRDRFEMNQIYPQPGIFFPGLIYGGKGGFQRVEELNKEEVFPIFIFFWFCFL